MNIKSLIIAAIDIDAEQLAKEAMKRAEANSKRVQDQGGVPNLVQEALKKKKTQPQINRELLKEKWRPFGYIFGLELLDLVGKWKIKDWLGEELEIITNLPKCLQVSGDLDPKDIEKLIFYAFSNELIKEGIKQPPSISGDNFGIDQDNWLYLHRVGKFNGAKTKEEAIDGWLKEVGFIIKENRQYNAALKRVDQTQIFLRDMLYAGKIKAVRVIKEDFEDVSVSHWLNDNSVEVFCPQNPSIDILFLQKDVKSLLKNKPINNSNEVFLKKRGRKKGDGAYNDAPFIKEMNMLLNEGKAKSAQDAATIIVGKYKNGTSENYIGGQSDEAKIDRLARKYRSKA